MVKIELKLAQNFCDDGTILHRHIHSHQKDHWHKVHPHDLWQQKDYEIWALGTWDPYEKFWHRQKKASVKYYKFVWKVHNYFLWFLLALLKWQQLLQPKQTRYAVTCGSIWILQIKSTGLQVIFFTRNEHRCLIRTNGLLFPCPLWWDRLFQHGRRRYWRCWQNKFSVWSFVKNQKQFTW